MDPPPLRLGALARVTRFGITEVNPIEGPAEQGAPLDPTVRYATAEDARKARAQTERVLWHNTGSPHGRTKQTVRKSTGTAHATRVLYNMNENSGPYGWYGEGSRPQPQAHEQVERHAEGGHYMTDVGGTNALAEQDAQHAAATALSDGLSARGLPLWPSAANESLESPHDPSTMPAAVVSAVSAALGSAANTSSAKDGCEVAPGVPWTCTLM